MEILELKNIITEVKTFPRGAQQTFRRGWRKNWQMWGWVVWDCTVYRAEREKRTESQTSVAGYHASQGRHDLVRVQELGSGVPSEPSVASTHCPAKASQCGHSWQEGAKEPTPHLPRGVLNSFHSVKDFLSLYFGWLPRVKKAEGIFEETKSITSQIWFNLHTEKSNL